MIRALTLALTLAAGPLAAQEIPLPRAEGPEVGVADGGILRALDKITGQVTDLPLLAGSTAEFGRIQVTLSECRYPVQNPNGDAFALVSVSEVGRSLPVFEGWIIASSPALHAMDHARYDVWVLRCSNA